MQMSRKADYALRAVTLLATLGPERTMQSQELAEATGVPRKFLEQILLLLKRAGILYSKRGVGGGYRLSRESRKIVVAEVVEAVDGELVKFQSDDIPPGFPGSAGLSDFLREAEESANSALRSATIEDVVHRGGGDSMVGYGI